MPRGRHQGKSEGWWTRAVEKVCGQVGPTESKEQYIIRNVMQICQGGISLPGNDDLASDIILKLWERGGFSWDIEHIKAYTWAHIRHAISNYNHRRTKNACDFTFDDEEMDIISMRAICSPQQETHMEALEALALVRALPDAQSSVLMILADGGSPLDVASELGIDPWTALQRIAEARANIHRVDPL